MAAGKSFSLAWKKIHTATGVLEGALGAIKADEILEGVKSMLGS